MIIEFYKLLKYVFRATVYFKWLVVHVSEFWGSSHESPFSKRVYNWVKYFNLFDQLLRHVSETATLKTSHTHNDNSMIIQTSN